MLQLPVNSDINSRSALLAMICLAIMGNVGILVQPLMIGGMVEHIGLSSGDAGLVVSGEMLGLALASLLGALVVHLVDRRLLAWVGIAIFAAGNIAAGVCESFWPLFLVRTLTGFGAGTLLVAFNASGAATRVPEKLFAMAITIFLVFSAVFLMLVVQILAAGGLAAAYACLAVFGIPAAIAIVWLPPRVTVEQHDIGSGKSTKLTLAITVLIAMLVLYAGTSALWAYQERIGIALGLSADGVGMVLGIAVGFGVIGAGLAWAVGVKMGVPLCCLALCAALLLQHYCWFIPVACQDIV